jgi:hypothetical protein
MTIFNDKVVFLDGDNVSVLAEFNLPGDGNVRWWCDSIDGWDDTADLNISIVNFGTSDGGYPANRFPAKERYITLQGACQASSRALAEKSMDDLVRACPPGKDFNIVRYESIPKRVNGRLASAIEFPQRFENEFRWMFTFVIPEAIKESATVNSGFINSWVGGLIYRNYTGAVTGDTNWVQNSSFEVDITTGVSRYAGISTSVDTAIKNDGTKSLKCTADNAQALSGVAMRSMSTSPNSWPQIWWSGSVDLRGATGGEKVGTWLRFYNSDGTIFESERIERTLTTTWQTFTCSLDGDASDDTKVIDSIEMHVRTLTASGPIWYVDKVHINAGPTPTPFFNGGSSNVCFWTGAANLTPSSKEAFGKLGGRRSYNSYTRESIIGSGNESGVIEQVDLDNAGTAVAFPITTVTGPLYNRAWEIRNETTGERLSFRMDVPEGFSLVIDHRKRTAVMNGQHFEYRKDGTWWGLIPGNNRLRLATEAFNAAATATFDYYDAWRN